MNRAQINGQWEFQDDYLVMRFINEAEVSTVSSLLLHYITNERSKELDTFEVEPTWAS